MHELTFGKFKINETSPTLIIAEFSDGHEGDVGHAKKLIDAAHAAGADVVKFQMHLPDVEMVPGVTMWAGDLQDILKKVWLSPEKHKEVMEYCKKKGVQYLCTPFSPAATDVLVELGVDGFKTGSGEICNLPHHRKLAKISAETGKPVFVSTGMCTMDELSETVSIYKEEGAHFAIMNCTSEYPIKDYSHTRLGLIPVLRETFDCPVGHSDHTDNPYTAIGAAALGARIIEKHFTLDRSGTFPDDFMSLDPPMMRVCVEGIRAAERAAMGNTKEILPDEKAVREWAFHSVVSDKDLKRGDAITLENVRPARPGWGIPAKFLDKKHNDKLLGKKANKDIKKNTVITWDDIE